MFDDLKADDPYFIPQMGSWPETHHIFDEAAIWALRAAVCSERPLLIQGEPGCGKSQLARAAAHVSGRAFISEFVHSRTESRDLQWRFDAVARLGEAQAQSIAGRNQGEGDPLNPCKFLEPGPLWWAFSWKSARDQAETFRSQVSEPHTPDGWCPSKGCVLLIDEIDKAEADLPNGLLETLGNGAFTVPYVNKIIGFAENTPKPLVIITTNEERELPNAFLRRCLVLRMELKKERKELISWLMERGAAHYGKWCNEKVCREAAQMLWNDRQDAKNAGVAAPGQAEYLDILKAVSRLGKDETDQIKKLQKIRDFVYIKVKRS